MDCLLFCFQFNENRFLVDIVENNYSAKTLIADLFGNSFRDIGSTNWWSILFGHYARRMANQYLTTFWRNHTIETLVWYKTICSYTWEVSGNARKMQVHSKCRKIRKLSKISGWFLTSKIWNTILFLWKLIMCLTFRIFLLLKHY